MTKFFIIYLILRKGGGAWLMCWFCCSLIARRFSWACWSAACKRTYSPSYFHRKSCRSTNAPSLKMVAGGPGEICVKHKRHLKCSCQHIGQVQVSLLTYGLNYISVEWLIEEYWYCRIYPHHYQPVGLPCFESFFCETQLGFQFSFLPLKFDQFFSSFLGEPTWVWNVVWSTIANLLQTGCSVHVDTKEYFVEKLQRSLLLSLLPKNLRVVAPKNPVLLYFSPYRNVLLTYCWIKLLKRRWWMPGWRDFVQVRVMSAPFWNTVTNRTGASDWLLLLVRNGSFPRPSSVSIF